VLKRYRHKSMKDGAQLALAGSAARCKRLTIWMRQKPDTGILRVEARAAASARRVDTATSLHSHLHWFRVADKAGVVNHARPRGA
jgi:hypothetical protein